MDCGRFLEAQHIFVDGELDEDRTIELLAHAESCEPCALSLGRLKALHQRIVEVVPPEIPADLGCTIVQAAERVLEDERALARRALPVRAAGYLAAAARALLPRGGTCPRCGRVLGLGLASCGHCREHELTAVPAPHGIGLALALVGLLSAVAVWPRAGLHPAAPSPASPANPSASRSVAATASSSVPAELPVALEPMPKPSPTLEDRKTPLWVAHGEKALRGSGEDSRELEMAYTAGKGLRKDPAAAFQWALRLALQGDTGAQYRVGVLYMKGQGVAKDPRRAARWFWECARAGHISGQVSIGACYQTGTGVKRDHAKAFAWYMAAAGRGEPEAFFRVGLYHEYGWASEKDLTRAAQWYEKAVAKGNHGAELKLAVLLFNGQGVARDPARSYHLFERSARAGNRVAMRNVANILRVGVPGVPPDREKAIAWYRKAVDAGDAIAARRLAEMTQKAPPVQAPSARASAARASAVPASAAPASAAPAPSPRR